MSVWLCDHGCFFSSAITSVQLCDSFKRPHKKGHTRPVKYKGKYKRVASLLLDTGGHHGWFDYCIKVDIGDRL